jgi:hypothetical protein
MKKKEKVRDLKNILNSLHWVDRDKLTANNYNPNKVTRENLELIKQSILTNGWTLPLVVRPDYTIIDGYHRWTIAGEEPLKTLLNNEVPVVVVYHEDEVSNIYGTITHNRARGQHLLDPMKAIIKQLTDRHVATSEICKQLGMKPEEVFRLSDLTREDFLALMVTDKAYSNAEYHTKT